MARELGNVVPFLEDLLQDGLSRRGGGRVVRLALSLNQEPPQLLRRHVGPTLRVLTERLLHVSRRLRLHHSELPREAHAYPVTPHNQITLSLYFSLSHTQTHTEARNAQVCGG